MAEEMGLIEAIVAEKGEAIKLEDLSRKTGYDENLIGMFAAWRPVGRTAFEVSCKLKVSVFFLSPHHEASYGHRCLRRDGRNELSL